MQKMILPMLCLAILTSCQRYDLYLRQIPVTEKSLASYAVKSPDPRQKNPPFGQKIVMNWSLPSGIVQQKPVLIFHVIYKNHTEETIVYPIQSRKGSHIFSLLCEKYLATEGILTYKAKIQLPDGTIYQEWKHQLWVSLITLDDKRLDA